MILKDADVLKKSFLLIFKAHALQKQAEKRFGSCSEADYEGADRSAGSWFLQSNTNEPMIIYSFFFFFFFIYRKQLCFAKIQH